jgi:hypothetical protein
VPLLVDDMNGRERSQCDRQQAILTAAAPRGGRAKQGRWRRRACSSSWTCTVHVAEIKKTPSHPLLRWIMANYIRTIVSGGKARFKDKELDVDLGAPYP